jgi:molybdopterin-guanine dinucleotide biosynthesis protein A
MARESSTVRTHLSGFVLAGGASSRMGRDKAQIPWGAGTLLTHAIEQMKRVSEDVFVVGAVKANNLPVTVLPDKESGLGPLAGIHAALSHSATDWNLILAVDLPLITSEMLTFLLRFQADGSEAAIVPRVKSRLQPLCAVYHRDLLPEVERALTSRESSIHRLLERLSTRIIEEDQLIANGFAPETFLNVNTPEDLERARALAKIMHV